MTASEFVARELSAADLPSGPYDDRSDVIEVMGPVVTAIVERAVGEERKAIAAALVKAEAEYNDRGAWPSDVRDIAAALAEGDGVADWLGR